MIHTLHKRFMGKSNSEKKFAAMLKRYIKFNTRFANLVSQGWLKLRLDHTDPTNILVHKA